MHLQGSITDKAKLCVGTWIPSFASHYGLTCFRSLSCIFVCFFWRTLFEQLIVVKHWKGTVTLLKTCRLKQVEELKMQTYIQGCCFMTLCWLYFEVRKRVFWVTISGMASAMHRRPLQNHLLGHLGGDGRRRGRQRKCWMDNVKEWTPLPMPELFTRASYREGRKRVSAESPLVCHPDDQAMKGLNWNDWSITHSKCHHSTAGLTPMPVFSEFSSCDMRTHFSCWTPKEAAVCNQGDRTLIGVLCINSPRYTRQGVGFKLWFWSVVPVRHNIFRESFFL